MGEIDLRVKPRRHRTRPPLGFLVGPPGNENQESNQGSEHRSSSRDDFQSAEHRGGAYRIRLPECGPGSMRRENQSR